LDAILFEVEDGGKFRGPSSTRSGSPTSVRSVAALILTIIQTYPSICYRHSERKSPPCIGTQTREGERSRNDFVAASLRGVQDATQAADYFVTRCLQLIQKQRAHCKDTDQTFKCWLDDFILDLFLRLSNPEWPSAELVLQLVGLKCIEFVGEKKNKADGGDRRNERSIERENHVTDDSKLVALSILGQITSEIAILREDLACNGADSDSLMELLRMVSVRGSSQTLGVPNESKNGTSGSRCGDAAAFRISQWIAKVVANNSETLPVRGPGMPDFDALLQSLAKAAQSSNASMCSYILESPHLTKTLLDQSGLIRCFDGFVHHIIAVTMHKLPTFRVKALRVLLDIIKADSALICRSNIFVLVEKRMSDLSSAVREVALEIISKLLKEPAGGMVLETVFERSCDIAPSVRRKAIRILTSYASSISNETIQVEIVSKLLCRTVDTETSVRVSVPFDKANIRAPHLRPWKNSYFQDPKPSLAHWDHRCLNEQCSNFFVKIRGKSIGCLRNICGRSA